jgi:hypothetical protein
LEHDFDLAYKCKFAKYVGDGICNDKLNTVSCNFDGNDCCSNSSNYEHCDKCTCHVETCNYDDMAFGDSYCDDEINTEICDYDNGDCCDNPNVGFYVDKTYCQECHCKFKSCST